jgi:hypothetical protein
VCFGLDALLLVYAQSWLSVAFHAFVLYSLFRGFAASRSLRQGT